MQSLTIRILGALVLTAMVAGDAANAAPTRYFIPSDPKPTTHKKAVAKSKIQLIEIKPKKVAHASYQRRVPSYSRTTYGGRGDYLNQVGGSSRWAPGHTIQVYVAPGRASYKNIVANAMNQWSRASGGRIAWTLTGNPSSADYTIGWTSAQREVSAGTEAGLTTTDTLVNPYTGAETIDHARTRILTRYNGRQLSDAEIAETTLHEIGHALGLEGHSTNPRDIMYYAAASGQHGLTARDMNTIQRLYND